MLIHAIDGRQVGEASIAYSFFLHFCASSNSVYREEPPSVV